MTCIRKSVINITFIFGLLIYQSFNLALATADPLPSWRDTASKQAIIEYVEKVTTKGNTFIAPEDRIAVFDHDGTLWTEKPIYPQLQFALDRAKELAPEHLEWQKNPTLKAAAEGDVKAALKGGDKSIIEIVMATHADMTTDEFQEIVSQWIRTAKDKHTGRLYTDMVFQPMLEVLDYLRAHGFIIYIATGGGIEFLRVWAERVYGVPPENVIGSSIKTRFKMTDEGPLLIRLAKVDFIDDKAGKPVAINKFIGKRPVFTIGNSDGDWQMLQWTAAGSKPSFKGIVHHTDSKREYAYDRNSAVGRLDKALDDAKARHWTVIDMKKDWKVIYPKVD